MRQTIGIGHQDFEDIRLEHCFYVDKTDFIREWWEYRDCVTLITRPRRFGKTLAMSMVEKFFSVKYAGRGDLFEGLAVWEREEYRRLQGSYPVISLSLANVKDTIYADARKKICQILENVYSQFYFLLDGEILNPNEKRYFKSVTSDMDDPTATMALHQLSMFLSRFYGKKVIILLDEYDTPMQEAYVNGYWDEMTAFIRNLFNSTFKTNAFLLRAIMTGITRVSRESVFSDLNNLEVVTTTSCKYASSFGFTEEEVFSALDEYGLSDSRKLVKMWYDGFTFGLQKDIYNPWSIINFLEKKRPDIYWANTSSNQLVGKLIRQGSKTVKQDFEKLLSGQALETKIDEQIVYNCLDTNENAIWSLLLASGYLKVKEIRTACSGGEEYPGSYRQIYELVLTNLEVKFMFENMVKEWFAPGASDYSDFIRALLADDVDAMNVYMNRVALQTFSFFDVGNRPSKEAEPERFYHGFVLGLMVELADRYVITSNRESGFGRYDIMLKSRRENQEGRDAIIIEFKVFNPAKEKDLGETVEKAKEQIAARQYEAALEAEGIPADRIRRYGFAFCGKQVLIG
ncbi:MAG: AAA family ATPase [Lachnospiraceae bacterium]|nr:AAA family ATPase [Lachnospiraceae bacterium]